MKANSGGVGILEIVNTEEELIELAKDAEIEKLKADIKIMREALEFSRKIHSENTCYDDCGFKPEEEPKEILVACFINNDFQGRKAIQKIDEALEKVSK